MNKPPDYDTTKAATDYQNLEAGAYVCKIKNLQETTSKSGRPMITVALDIAEGEFTDHFLSRYRRAANSADYDPKWGCNSYVLLYTEDGRTNGQFKRFVEAVEHSNAGFTPAWGDGFAQSFAGKLVGCVFRREEYVGRDGKSHWSTKPYSFYSVQDLRNGEYSIPKDKELKQQNGWTQQGQAPQQYRPYTQTEQQQTIGMPQGFEAISDEDLPF